MADHLLTRSSSLLRRQHPLAVRLAVRGPAYAAWTCASLLPGHRDFGWPMMVLSVRRELGHVRAALAQRAVAGTMTIYPPIPVSTGGPVATDDARPGPISNAGA